MPRRSLLSASVVVTQLGNAVVILWNAVYFGKYQIVPQDWQSRHGCGPLLLAGRHFFGIPL